MTSVPIPADFDPSGLLAPGTYVATLGLLRTSLLVAGPPAAIAAWDREHRANLVDQLAILVRDLRQVGIDRIFIDGSFCTDKPRPGDIDGYFVTSFTEWPARLAELRMLRPSWTWDPRDRRPDAIGKLKLPMWHHHRVELFPVFDPPFYERSFRGIGPILIDDFSRRTRGNEPKGIVQIAKEPQA